MLFLYILPLYMLATSKFIINIFALENQLFIRVIENKKKYFVFTSIYKSSLFIFAYFST